MLARFLHAIGLTNLTDEQVAAYQRLDNHIRRPTDDRIMSWGLLACASLALAGLLIIPARENSRFNLLAGSIESKLSLTREAIGEVKAEIAAQGRLASRSGAVIDEISSRLSRFEGSVATMETEIREVRKKSSEIYDEILSGRDQDDRSSLAALDIRTSKLEARASILKYGIIEEFNAGAIVTPGNTSIYNEREVEKFINDAEDLIKRTPPDGDPGKFYFVDGTYSNGDCDGAPTGCLSIGLEVMREGLSKSQQEPGQEMVFVRVEARFGSNTAGKLSEMNPRDLHLMKLNLESKRVRLCALGEKSTPILSPRQAQSHALRWPHADVLRRLVLQDVTPLIRRSYDSATWGAEPDRWTPEFSPSRRTTTAMQTDGAARRR